MQSKVWITTSWWLAMVLMILNPLNSKSILHDPRATRIAQPPRMSTVTCFRRLDYYPKRFGVQKSTLRIGEYGIRYSYDNEKDVIMTVSLTGQSGASRISLYTALAMNSFVKIRHQIKNLSSLPEVGFPIIFW